jgi:hypothetical protein
VRGRVGHLCMKNMSGETRLKCAFSWIEGGQGVTSDS